MDIDKKKIKSITAYSKFFSKSIDTVISDVKWDTNNAEVSKMNKLAEMKLATMTLCLKRSNNTLSGIVNRSIKLQDLEARAQGGELVPSQIKKFPNSAAYSLKSNGKGNPIRIFVNGTIMLWGVKSGKIVKDMLVATLQAMGISNKATIKAIKMKDFDESAAMSIIMMNWFCHVGFNVDISALYNSLNVDYPQKFTFDFERSRRKNNTFVLTNRVLKNLLGFDASIIIYSSGKIMLSGVKKEDIIDAYSFIMNYLMEHRASVEQL